MLEEPCISGTRGSGAVFFSGCSLRCIFCQNYEIAQGNCAREISGDRLSEIFLELQEKGAANINLVTATHFAPAVIGALKKAKAQGMYLPVIYNSSGYERVETVQMLEEVVDVWLPVLNIWIRSLPLPVRKRKIIRKLRWRDPGDVVGRRKVRIR